MIKEPFKFNKNFITCELFHFVVDLDLRNSHIQDSYILSLFFL
jgi:hypothetical protein